jgi:hypothetical protein
VKKTRPFYIINFKIAKKAAMRSHASKPKVSDVDHTKKNLVRTAQEDTNGNPHIEVQK